MYIFFSQWQLENLSFNKYLKVTIICRYNFLRFWLKPHFASTNFAVCTQKWYRVNNSNVQ